jgi:GntR family transcriptional regulator, negative regulator for fad regulon and positive regulator of fabA
MIQKQKKIIRPAQFAEYEITKAIVSNDWVPGQNLPPERELADLLGVTRPTLREVLQRLSRDGWIKITHGRPTMVNDIKNNGGLGILKALVNFKELAANSLIRDWLEFRVLILPDLASRAIRENKDFFLSLLEDAPSLDSKPEKFETFDWALQLLMIKHSKNSIAQMIYNDLTEVYRKERVAYFDNTLTKKKSYEYYDALKNAILKDENSIKTIVKHTMEESLAIWENTNKSN